MVKEMDLCGICAALLGNAYSVRKVSGGVDNKVTCANCGKRRYGASYEVKKMPRRVD